MKFREAVRSLASRLRARRLDPLASSPEVVAWVRQVADVVNTAAGVPGGKVVLVGSVDGEAVLFTDATPPGGKADDYALHPVLHMTQHDPDLGGEGFVGDSVIRGPLDEEAAHEVAARVLDLVRKPDPSPPEADERAAFRAEVARRVLAGEADPVLDLLRDESLTWDAVFGMEDYLLMEVYLPWFDPDSVLQFPRKPEVVGILEFLDQVNERVRNGHRVLRHDDPKQRRLGFADVTAREIVYAHLVRVKEAGLVGHPGFLAYDGLPSSRRTVRIPRNLASDPDGWE